MDEITEEQFKSDKAAKYKLESKAIELITNKVIEDLDNWKMLFV